MAPLNPRAPEFIPSPEFSPAPLSAPCWLPNTLSPGINYPFILPQPAPELLVPSFCHEIIPHLPIQSCFFSLPRFDFPWSYPSLSPPTLPPLLSYHVTVPFLQTPLPPIYAAKQNVIIEEISKEIKCEENPPPSLSPPPSSPLRAINLSRRRVRIGPRLKLKGDTLVARVRRQGKPLLSFRVNSFWLPRLRCLRKKCPEEEKLQAQLQFNGGDERKENGDFRTTVMIKNLPNKMRKEDLLSLLDAHCVRENKAGFHSKERKRSQFDFFYLPMDFGTGSNLGYAFVNFTCYDGAWSFYRAFHMKKWDSLGSRKTCEVTYARIQGLESLLKHFRCSVFLCEDEELLPVYFVPHRDGVMQFECHHVGRRISQ